MVLLMMITAKTVAKMEIVYGNILNANVEALVNTVNTQGIMGKGIAAQFKKAFPAMFKEYQKACKQGQVKIGQMHVYEYSEMSHPHFIINFPTKNEWQKPANLSYIKAGLDALLIEITRRGIHSIAIPALGCGLGGLSWDDVKPLIESVCKKIPDVRVLIYPPQKTPEKNHTYIRPEMNINRALMLLLLKQYCTFSDDELTLLPVQKLLYFLQEAGQPLKLRFVKYHYGPYADNLRYVLEKLQGYFIEKIDDELKPNTLIKLIDQATNEAEMFLQQELSDDDDQVRRLQRVRMLITGFEFSYGLELLATVHWVVKHDAISADHPEKVIEAIHSWNKRKSHVMKSEHIKIALEHLQKEEWL